MRLLMMTFLLCVILAPQVAAEEYIAPIAPEEVQDLMPVQNTSFGQDLWKIIRDASGRLYPEFSASVRVCVGIFAIIMCVSILRVLPGSSENIVKLVGTLAIAALMMHHTGSLIQTAADTVTELSEYGKLLLPVIAGATAAQGGISTSTALYTGTLVFDTILTSCIRLLVIPVVYAFWILNIAACATGQGTLDKLKGFTKWLATWLLKTILYIFTGYITVTGVVSASTDATTLKAAKLTMSGMIPVVGGILSDASEAVLTGAAVMKNAAGVYGLLVICAIWITPFFKIGIRYLLLKLTAAVSQVFGVKELSDMVTSFSESLGLLLAITGAISIMLFISVVCFLKGVG